MDTQRTKISAFIYKLIGEQLGEEQGRRRGNSQRHATRARHTRALHSSIHVAILWRIFSSCSCICRYFSRCIFHCHCICTCSCVSICACILHFSFNYVHLNPRPIRIFSHFCGLQRRGSATERRDRSMATDCGIETNPSALWLLPLSLLLSLLFLTALAIPRHHCSPHSPPPPPSLFVCFHWRRVKWIQRN